MSGIHVLGIPVEYYYPAFTIFMLLLTIIFVPRNKFKSLFWLSLLWGFLGSMVVGMIFGGIFKMFRWEYAMPFMFLGHPTWINLAWFLAMILYFYYLPTQKAWYFLALYVIVFAVASTNLDVIFQQIGMLHYLHWRPFYRFLVAIVWFYGAAYHYQYLKNKGEIRDL
ncbi:MAG TPA: hypothetical protein VHY08_16875 [Bacillota bacterium]|nr:hypothetical protein [Bacillota bacterium]